MKKLYVFIILNFLLQSNGFAQKGWSSIYKFPYRQSQYNISVFFKDSLNGFAFPAQNGLYKTTDGGESWYTFNITNLEWDISKIIAINKDSLVGIGGGGTIIISSDRGNTWTVKNIGSYDNLTSVCATSDGEIFISSSGKKIYKSTDNGNSWNIYSLDTLQRALSSISFINSQVGYGVGIYPVSIKTTDGGNTWYSIPPVIPSATIMFALKFLDENHGIAVGDDKLAVTSDGGVTWQVKYSTGKYLLYDVTTFKKNIAWVVGGDKILKTDDAGRNWYQQVFPSDYISLTSAFCVDSLHCYAVGAEGGEQTLFKTSDGGFTAPTLSSPNNYSSSLPLTIKLIWNSVLQGNGYKVQVATESGFNNIVLDTLCDSTTLQHIKLKFNTTYYWRVQEKFGNMSSPWSDIWYFKTTDGAPKLISPDNGTKAVSLTSAFSWNDVTLAASHYQFQLSTDSLFNFLIYDNNTITNNSITINNLSDSTLYYWRVRVNVNNAYGEWSEKWKFRTLARTPYLIYPINKGFSIPANVEFKWSSAYNVKNYILQVSTDSLSSSNIVDNIDVNDTAKNVTLNLNTKYYWRVGAKNLDGLIYWSKHWKFNTGNEYTAPLFPLNIGNIWYYQAGSNQRGYYYGVRKEITDTLSDGFREITDTYYYKDSIKTGKEYWGYIDGKFYIGHQTSDYVYDDYLTKDSCSPGYSGDCWYLVKYELFDSTYSGQQRYVHVGYMSGATLDKITIVPEIGLVKNYSYVYVIMTGARTDTSYLIGMYKNGEVLGDTTFKIPVDTVTASFPLNIGQTWTYHVYYNNRDNNEKVIRKVTKILDNGYREITLTYLFTTGIQIKKEYWLYKDGKFYYSDLPDMSSPIICYDVTLKAEECTFHNVQICVGWSSNKYSYNGKDYDMQFHQYYDGATENIINVANNIGPVEFYHSGATEELISMSVDTTIPKYIASPESPLNNSTEIKRSTELKWEKIKDAVSYDIQISKDSTFNNLFKEYTGLTDTSISIDSLDYSAKYYWRVKTVSSLGYIYWSAIWKFTTISLPTKFELYQNYPNPFNPTTKIKYDLPVKAHVLLKIYDILGREVLTLVNEERPAGSYKVEFNGKNLASGIYFYMLKAGNYYSVKKMILMK